MRLNRTNLEQHGLLVHEYIINAKISSYQLETREWFDEGGQSFVAHPPVMDWRWENFETF